MKKVICKNEQDHSTAEFDARVNLFFDELNDIENKYDLTITEANLLGAIVQPRKDYLMARKIHDVVSNFYSHYGIL